MVPGQIASQADADAFIRPHAETLSSAILGAIDDWRALLAKQPEVMAGVGTRTQNGFIHERTVFRLTVAWRDAPHGGLRMAKVNGLHVAILNDVVMLKLKRLNLKLRSRNIQTGQTVAFDHQHQLLPGPVMTNATSGFLLDAAKNVSRAVVVCWEGREQLWAVDLLGNAGSAGQLVELPASPAPTPRRRTKVITPIEQAANADQPSS